MAGQGMGRAPGVGHRRAGGQAHGGGLVDQVEKEGLVAAMAVGRARRVDDQSVRRIGRDDGGVPPQRPQG
jgi:hypothetical protein